MPNSFHIRLNILIGTSTLIPAARGWTRTCQDSGVGANQLRGSWISLVCPLTPRAASAQNNLLPNWLALFRNFHCCRKVKFQFFCRCKHMNFGTTEETTTGCFGIPFPITSLEGRNYDDTPSARVHGVRSESNARNVMVGPDSPFPNLSNTRPDVH